MYVCIESCMSSAIKKFAVLAVTFPGYLEVESMKLYPYIQSHLIDVVGF